MNLHNGKISFLEVIAYVITFIGVVVMIIFLINLSSTYGIGGYLSTDDMAATGQVGDFMGGVIGSLWALAGVFLYFSAVKMQNKELENQAKYRREDAIMDAIKDFESTFFSLLDSQRKIKTELVGDFDDVKMENGNKMDGETLSASGNEFFKEAYIVLQKLYSFTERNDFLINLNPNKDLPFAKNKEEQKQIKARFSEDLTIVRLGLADEGQELLKRIKAKKSELKRCQALYLLFFVHFFSTIGHYCRHLYNIMKYMNQAQMDVIVMIRNTFENGELEEKIKDAETRFKRYAAFLQSSLSSSEMSILFYNSLIYDKARKLYIQYNLLENLQDIYLIKPEHKDLIPGFKCKSPDKMIEDYLSVEE